MSHAVQMVTADARTAHAHILKGWALAKSLTAAGRAVRITVSGNPSRTLAQNRWYWGFVLQTIAAQARDADGRMYEAAVWHGYFKRRVLGLDIDEAESGLSCAVRSTQGLGVREMQDFLDEVCAIAVTELGVAFDDGWWE